MYTPKSTPGHHPHAKAAPGATGATPAQTAPGEPISAADARMRLAGAAVEQAQVLTTEARRHLDEARASMLESVARYRQSIGEALSSLRRSGEQPGVSSDAILKLARDLNAETQAAVGRVMASFTQHGGAGGAGPAAADEATGDTHAGDASLSRTTEADGAAIEHAEREAEHAQRATDQAARQAEADMARELNTALREAEHAEREAEHAVASSEAEAIRQIEQGMREAEHAAREAELAMSQQTEPHHPKG